MDPKLTVDSIRAWSTGVVRFAYAVFRQIKEAGLDYRAMSLVYTSLLALIPLLAVSFSVLKAFGADDYLEPIIMEMLDPLGEKKEPVAAFILSSVRGLDVGLLGSVGLLSLLYTSMSLLEKIEDSFNYIWRRRSKLSRGLMRRVSDYLSFILVGPLLVFSAFGGMNELVQHVPDVQEVKGAMGPLMAMLQPMLPALFIIAAFTFIYKLIPDAPVNTLSALVGGVMAGLSWKLAGWVFATFMATSAQYNAVYSTFAILILLMVWVDLSWLIVLLGVQVSFFHQHPRYLSLRNRETHLSCKLFERLGLLVMVLIGRRFFQGKPPWSINEFSSRLELPELCVDDLLQVLTEKGFIMSLGGQPETFAPARDFSTIAVLDVLDAMRSAHEDDFPINAGGVGEPVVDGLFKQFDESVRAIGGLATVRDLVLEVDQ
jgi:membrane protein